VDGGAAQLVRATARVGDLSGAEAAFRQAGELGRAPQPGLALIRLAQGRTDAAAAAIAGAVAEEGNRLMRARLLAAQVEIAIAAADIAAARGAARELDAIAAEYESPALRASAAQARGAVELVGEDPAGALRWLREAWQLWQDSNCPFESAQAQRLLGTAYRRLGDEDGAELALSAALAGFERLGAELERARTAELLGVRPRPAGLTVRELEVLRLVARGASNREIADELCLSVKTVARHLNNIFCKLNVSSRTAASAFAHRHGLIEDS
jgi:DNA-binding CsgD family transcriptional regulator